MMVLAVFALVAALAALAALAIFAADWPATLETTVEAWVPVTSPAREPVKLAALPETLPSTFPDSGPVKAPLMMLPVLVATMRPEKLLLPSNPLLPLSRGILPESRASASVPEETLPAFRLVSPEPLPLMLVEVIAPPEKLPEPSRLTMVLAVL